jgi:hypothetical protein
MVSYSSTFTPLQSEPRPTNNMASAKQADAFQRWARDALGVRHRELQRETSVHNGKPCSISVRARVRRKCSHKRTN